LCSTTYTIDYKICFIDETWGNEDNIKFNVAQVVNILLWNWFLIESTFIIPNFEEEDEGVARAPLET
jgi:hypothetical protein